LAARSPALIITCEHGGNRIPPQYQHLFRGRRQVLGSHRGYDIGALTLARRLATYLDAPLHYTTVSRLLVDLNRSVHHRAVFSPVIRRLDPASRIKLLKKYYFPYRAAVERRIEHAVSRNRVIIHVSVHSFTPTLGGHKRQAEIGLLYDPARADELALCRGLKNTLLKIAPSLRVRRNYPYRGTADGFTTWLRRCFPKNRYAGIELEINQQYPLGNAQTWCTLQRLVAEAFDATLNTR
jgi:predicted N-formylglutamate amidohydrolase